MPRELVLAMERTIIALGESGVDAAITTGDDDDVGAMAATILALLARRDAGKTICPSEAARAYAAEIENAEWRSFMPVARNAARILALQGIIAVTQRGRMLPLDGVWRGAIRLRRIA
jgi:Protein of unknown function (DUF3253)